jgi:hypothetical protein
VFTAQPPGTGEERIARWRPISLDTGESFTDDGPDRERELFSYFLSLFREIVTPMKV